MFQDVLHEPDIDLDYAFKSSIVRDVIQVSNIDFVKTEALIKLKQGLDYLHNKSQLNFHGNLSSTSCLISSRWVVCLSDFGLDRILNSRYIDGTLGNLFLEFG